MSIKFVKYVFTHGVTLYPSTISLKHFSKDYYGDVIYLDPPSLIQTFLQKIILSTFSVF